MVTTDILQLWENVWREMSFFELSVVLTRNFISVLRS